MQRWEATGTPETAEKGSSLAPRDSVLDARVLAGTSGVGCHTVCTFWHIIGELCAASGTDCLHGH